jgi:hypothetical protein
MTTGPERAVDRKRLLMPMIGSALLLLFSIWASTFQLTGYQTITLEIARALSCVGLLVCGAAFFIPEWFAGQGTLLRFAVFVAIVVAFGFGYSHFSNAPKSLDKQATTVRICRGEYEGNCLPHEVFLGCSSPDEWARQHCSSTPSFRSLGSRDGNRCGYSLFEATCTAK